MSELGNKQQYCQQKNTLLEQEPGHAFPEKA
jgi:hypothetical protein